jgi:glutathione synthase/RimK-type ligase-like ATP-grasp enzyme
LRRPDANLALGAARRPVVPPRFASMPATVAAAAAAADLIGVDLLPDGEHGWVVLELDGAVEFTVEHALFAAAAWQLARVALGYAAGPNGQVATSLAG